VSERVIFIGGGMKVAFTGQHEAATGSTSFHDFTGVDYGQASSSGLLVLAAGFTGGPLANINSVEVDSVAATQVAYTATSGVGVGIYQIDGVSGTGTVRINIANNATVWRLAAWKLRGVRDFTAHDSDTDSGTSLGFDVPAHGVAIGYCLVSAPTSDHTWATLSRDFSSASGTARHSGAHLIFDAAQTPLNETITATGSVIRSAGASWR
jgi:hypothetical protein